MFVSKPVPDTWRHQTLILVHAWRTSIRFRISYAIIAAFCVGFVTKWANGLYLGTAFLMLEMLLWVAMFRFKAPVKDISLRAFCWVWFLNFVATGCYLAPTYFLYAANTLPTIIMGMFWITGVTLYSASNYANMSVFFYGEFVPAALMLVLSTTMLFFQAESQDDVVNWYFAIFGAFAFSVAAWGILHEQKTVLAKLEKAQRQADMRLMELEFLAEHDALTELPNRASFDNRLNAFLTSEKHFFGDLGVVLIDLDQFKPINDSFGHHAGDAVLIEVARRLMDVVQDNGIAARLGGDEFGLILKHIKTPAEAHQIAKEVSHLIRLPIPFKEEMLNVGGSVGVALVSEVGRDIKTLMQAADTAMFSAKKDPEQAAVVYNAASAPKRASLQDKRDLQEALATNAIRPFYQPKVDLLTGELVGLESLARWVHADGTVKTPGAFLPSLDELGMMGDFTFHMSKSVLQDLTKLINLGVRDMSVSINLDERTLATQNGLQDLLWLFSEYEEAAKCVTLEVTEDVVLARSGDFIRRAIETLAQQGMRISLDDFGTGFASFRHLQELTLHELKIDTSFVNTVGADPASKVIIEGFIGIAAGLGIDVVAEGIETEYQRSFLLNRGCRTGQGFLFSFAVPFETIVTRIQTGEPAAKKA